MIPLLARLADRLRPNEGWVPFLVVLAAVLSLPGGLLTPDPPPVGRPYLVTLALLAVLAGLGLARSELRTWTVALAGGLIGALLTGIAAASLWPPLGLLWRELANGLAWLQGTPGAEPPFSFLAGFFWQRLSAFAIRLWWWGQNTGGGIQDQDTIVLELLLALTVWSVSLLATWQIYRRRNALAGLLPLGSLVTLVAFFRGGLAVFYFFVFLACSLALIAAVRLWESRSRWEAEGIDYPAGIELDLALSLGAPLLIVLALAAFFPVLTVHPLHESFWRWMDEPWSRAEQVAERFFGPIESQVPRLAGRALGSSQLPQAHLLGSGPELSERIVLYVGTNDPPPPDSGEAGDLAPPPAQPQRYWRAATFDQYTGQGWTNSAMEPETVPADRFLDPDPPPGFDLVQQYQILAPDIDAVLAANAPYRLDHAVQACWRAPGDLARLGGRLTQYAAVSRVPEPNAAELRASLSPSDPLPAEIASRYLALPEELPQRVLDLAHQVAAGSETQYDAARHIEAYLRTYPYNLDLPEPPADRDLVDYFLFDLQEGYCDYYASAMVVLARAVGVPARLATGYAQGSYDPAARRWVVTEQNGHSWVEVYFGELGWVEFEPTAGLPALQRPGGEDQPALSIPDRPPKPQGWWQALPWPLLGMGLLVVALITFLLWLWRPRPPGTGPNPVLDRYSRLLRWGARLRHPLRNGQTPLEYGASLGQALRARGSHSLLRWVRQAGQEAPSQIQRLASTFAQARYARQPLGEREQSRTRELWARLRRHLWWLWLGAQHTRSGDEDQQTD
jgi:transglutaminase-like putative cysteine protease